jgi:hypothetical protein
MYGSLIKFSNETNSIGKIMFYSANSNSPLYTRYIYYINDFIWTNSSYTISNMDNYHLNLINMKPVFDHR